MPKRKRDEETKEERWERKMKKYEKLLEKPRRRCRRRVIYSSDESDVEQEDHLEVEDINIPAPASGPAPVPTTAPSMSHPGPSEVPTESSPVVEAPVDEIPVVEVPVAESSPEENEYDVTLLQSLGEPEIESAEFGDNIHTEIATRLQNILISGVTKEFREALVKKYLIPKNVPNLKAPTLNPEVEAMLVETCRLRDKRLFSKQDQLGRVLSALTSAMTDLLKKNPNITEVLRTLNDAAKLLADSHYAETETRRTIILPLIDKSLTEAFKNKKRDRLLFGESLSEAVKTSQGIKKTSQLISKNFKGPSASTRVRQQWVNQVNPQQPRAGGQRGTTTFGNRRRTGPPPASHHPPHPPPAPYRRPAPAPASAPAPPARRQMQTSTQRLDRYHR